jgi:DNA-binding transcriptional LysR family regulator
VDLRQLRSFVAVAEERSFTRAARRLRVAQPALSQQIHALEAELGVMLIERTNRTSGLTDAGVALRRRAERVLADADDAAREMADYAGVRRGTVRIGCALQTLVEGRLPTLLAAFAKSHPGIRVTLRETHTAQVLRLVARGAVDLGLVHVVRAGSGPAIGAERAGDELVLTRLYREPLAVIMHPRHPLARRAKVELDDLRDQPFVAFRPGSSVREALAHAAAARGFAMKIAFSTANMGSVRALVAAGLGVGVVPLSAAVGRGLAAAALTAPRLERVVTLVRNASRYEAASVTALREMLRAALRADDN